MSTQAILDQLLLVVLNISFWNGRKALSVSDLAVTGIDVDKLPPGTIATLESKQIIPQDTVKLFASLKREAIALCLNNGVRFGWDGYAIPRNNGTELLQQLKQLKERFDSAKTNYLSVYEQEVMEWIGSHPPELVPAISSLVHAASYIHEAIYFNYAAFEVKAPTGIADNGLDAEVNSLYGLLCQEIRLTAYRTHEYYFANRQEITRKTLRPIKAMRTKLAGLRFLDPSIDEMVQVIDDTLKRLPKYGVITGGDLNMVAELVGKRLATMGRVIPVLDDKQPAGIITSPEITIADDSGNVAPIAWDF